MLEQQVFDLAGKHAEAGALDKLLLSADDCQVSLFVHFADVTGIQPTVPYLFLRFFRLVPVALHHAWPFDDYLSLLSGGEFPLAGIQVNDFDIR